MRFNLKTRLWVLATGASLMCMLVGAIGAFTTYALQGDLQDLLQSQSVVRRQTESDMMHDAIHADVLALLLAQKNGDAGRQKDIAADLDEHGKRIRRLMEENAALVRSDETRALLNEIRPVVDRYVGHAAFIIEKGFASPEQAMARQKDFEQDFSWLEGKMEKLTESIEKDSASEVDASRRSVAHTALLIGSMASIATLLIMSGAFAIIRSLLHPLALLAGVARRVAASGDLTQRVAYAGKNELGESIEAFNHLLDSLQHLVSKTTGAVERVLLAVSDISERIARVSEDAGQQNQSAQSMAASIESLSENIAAIATMSRATLQLASEVDSSAREGGEDVRKTVACIQNIAGTVHSGAEVVLSLEDDIRKVDAIVGIIREIADQTNLLALNAAIEAARAGEYGRGFAVVADEVRSLSERTAQSTHEIVSMIQRIQETSRKTASSMQSGVGQVEAGVEIALLAGKSAEDIATRAQQAESAIEGINGKLDEQRHAGEALTRDVATVSGLASSTHEAVSGVQQALQALRGLCQELQTAVGSLRA